MQQLLKAPRKSCWLYGARCLVRALGLLCAGSMEVMVAGDLGIRLACPSSCPEGFAVRIPVVVL